jgi:cytidylate kinase
MSGNSLPKLITFDGEARSGKGTVVHAVKDYLRDECGYNVMLIDAGQVFRVLVVAATRSGVDVDDPTAIDAFLADEAEAERCVQFIKDVYHMDKDERDALLYTNEIGANSAKIGARPDAQEFKDNILRKWYHDAYIEGYDVILHDGRALEEVGSMLESEQLCKFVLGLYFTCDPMVGARRTLGYTAKSYDALNDTERSEVDELVVQINTRNSSDRERAVHPVIPPEDAMHYALPDAPQTMETDGRPMVIFDTSGEMTKEAMTKPVAEFCALVLKSTS